LPGIESKLGKKPGKYSWKKKKQNNSSKLIIEIVALS
jgi:hypothetical protein